MLSEEEGRYTFTIDCERGEKMRDKTTFIPLVLTSFAILSQIPLVYIYIAAEGVLYLESTVILLISSFLAIGGLYLLGIMLAEYLWKRITPKHEMEPPLLAAFSSLVLYFIGFFWMLMEVKPFSTPGETFLWAFVLSQLLPVVVLLLIVTILSSR